MIVPSFQHMTTRHTNRWLYVVLGNVVMMCLGTVYSWSVFRIPVEHTFGIGTTQSGLPYMVSLAFYALFMLFSGRYLDHFTPRKVMSLGAVLISLGWILSAYAPNIYVLTLTYGVISGAGVGIAYGVPLSIAAKWFPDKKGLAVGLVLVGFGLSPLVTAPLARTLIEQYGSSNTFMILGVAFGLIIPILSLPFRYPQAGQAPGDHKAQAQVPITREPHSTVVAVDVSTGVMMKSPEFKGLYFNFLIGAMIGLMLIGITGKVGVKMVGLTSKSVALWMSFFAIFNGLGRPTFGWLTDRLTFQKAAMLSYGMIACAALMMIKTQEGNTLFFGIAFSIFWFNLGGWLAIAPTSTLSLFGPRYYSQNYGVVFTAYGIGAIAGVFSSGMLIDWIGDYNAVFYMVIVLCLAGVLTTKRQVGNNSRKQLSRDER
jgi:MFS family permease